MKPERKKIRGRGARKEGGREIGRKWKSTTGKKGRMIS